MKAAAEKLVLRIAYPINPNSNAKPTSQIDALDEQLAANAIMKMNG